MGNRGCLSSRVYWRFEISLGYIQANQPPPRRTTISRNGEHERPFIGIATTEDEVYKWEIDRSILPSDKLVRSANRTVWIAGSFDRETVKSSYHKNKAVRTGKPIWSCTMQHARYNSCER